MVFAYNDRVKIHYEVEGIGEFLVLQHGFLGSMEDWHEYGYIQTLKNLFWLVLLDARGHGKSD